MTTEPPVLDDALWRDAYRTAFIEYALSRSGWDRETAEAWCNDIVDDSLCDFGGMDVSPVEIARADVRECEREMFSGA